VSVPCIVRTNNTVNAVSGDEDNDAGLLKEEGVDVFVDVNPSITFFHAFPLPE
jgi:hypothetical protein